MELQFLGTGGYHPNERRETSCLLLPEIGLVFDAGTGMYRLAERLRTTEIDLFLSHAHLDHIVGLTYLLVPIFQGKVAKVRVYGREEHLEAVRTHLFAPALFPVLPDYEFLPLDREVRLSGGGIVTHVSLEHPGGSTGFRLDLQGRSMAYITDTTAGLCDYDDLIRGVDLLVHECNFPDAYAEWSEKTGHSNLTPVLERARAAGVKRLVLTHFDPQTSGDDPVGLAASGSTSPATEIAEDLMSIHF